MKIILHGGATSKDNKQNDFFWKTITDNVRGKSARVLMCYFSREKEVWGKKYEFDSNKVIKMATKKTITRIVEDIDHLKGEIDNADALYVAGGEPELIEPLYKKMQFIKTALRNKVYAGSSMGAFMASTYYVDSSEIAKGVVRGIGLLPINVLCHWDVEKEKSDKIAALKKVSDLPILTLDETQSVVLYK